MLGVGTGEALNEIAVGLTDWPDFKGRFARLRESVRLMRRLWTEDRVTFEGDYFRTVDASIYDRPDQPIPVYIAAGGPTVAKYAGRQGDGFICTSGKGVELYRDQLMPAVREGLELNGRSEDAIDKMIEIKLSYDPPDPQRALENCRFWRRCRCRRSRSTTSPTPPRRWRPPPTPCRSSSRQALDRGVHPPRPPSSRSSSTPIWASTTWSSTAPGHDQERFLSTFAEQVVPGIRELG